MKILKLVVAMMTLSFVMPPSGFVSADETAREKIENEAEDAKRERRKATRRAKRKAREANERGSTMKNMEDGVNNALDDVEAGTKKSARKID